MSATTIGRAYAPIFARDLNASHIGRRVRVTDELGVIVEDELVELHAGLASTGSSISETVKVMVRLRNCGPAGQINNFDRYGFTLDPESHVDVAGA